MNWAVFGYKSGAAQVGCAVLDVWTVRSLADHRMMDRSRENVDDARHIKLDSIIPNKNYIKHDDTPLQLQMTLAALIMGWDQEVREPMGWLQYLHGVERWHRDQAAAAGHLSPPHFLITPHLHTSPLDFRNFHFDSLGIGRLGEPF